VIYYAYSFDTKVIEMGKWMDNIGIWGDSLLQGVILDENQGRYSILDSNAAVAFAKKVGITVNNNSKFGCTAPKGAKFLNRALESDVEFSAAIIEFGGNDCDFNWAEVSAAPDEEHMPKTPLDSFVKCYADMIQAVKAKGITPVLMSLPPLDAQRYFDWVTRNGLNKDNVLKWLGDVQHIYRWHERYSNAVSNLARTYSCHFIDIRDAFLSQRDCGKLMCADGIHPNQKGHALMEQVFFEYAREFAH
jgi:acyl-CoA thioesterase I